MKKSIITPTIAGFLALTVIVSNPAFGATASITNGDFQSGANGATSITGWNSVNERIDLGVTTIAGCSTVDTSDYSNLRDYLYEAIDDVYNTTATIDTTATTDANGDPIEFTYRNYIDPDTSAPILVNGFPVGRERVSDEEGDTISAQLFLELTSADPRERLLEEDWTPAQRLAASALVRDPVVANDSLAPSFYNTDFNVGLRSNSSVSDVYLESWQSYDPSFAWNSQFVEMFSELDADSAPENGSGYVVHGPAIYTDEFTAKPTDDLSFKFAASDRGDDYKVFGYLLNTATCAQTEVVDSTGESSTWQTINSPVPSNGTYRFVFVSGTYDKTWGSFAGAVMFVDDVVLTPNQERVAVAAAAEAARTTPAATLAKTGADVEWLLVTGFLAVITGSGFLAFSRRKRTA